MHSRRKHYTCRAIRNTLAHVNHGQKWTLKSDPRPSKGVQAKSEPNLRVCMEHVMNLGPTSGSNRELLAFGSEYGVTPKKFRNQPPWVFQLPSPEGRLQHRFQERSGGFVGPERSCLFSCVLYMYMYEMSMLVLVCRSRTASACSVLRLQPEKKQWPSGLQSARVPSWT